MSISCGKTLPACDVIGGSDVLHGDDTPVPVLAPGAGKTKTGRLWTYVRDERIDHRRRSSSILQTAKASDRSHI
jgi:hypothetical protein